MPIIYPTKLPITEGLYLILKELNEHIQSLIDFNKNIHTDAKAPVVINDLTNQMLECLID